MPVFTQYRWEGRSYSDMGSILGCLAEKGTAARITVQPGKHDITRWKRLRERYGGSRVRIGGDEPFDGILHDWRKSNGDAIELNVRVYITNKVDHSAWKDISELQKKLEEADGDNLAFYWRINS